VLRSQPCAQSLNSRWRDEAAQPSRRRARALKEALRSKSRAAPIRHLALAERAQNYLAHGKKAMARKDLERILAEDSTYAGVRERLAELS
jgi:Tfp pilus assembly protein PilF